MGSGLRSNERRCAQASREEAVARRAEARARLLAAEECRETAELQAPRGGRAACKYDLSGMWSKFSQGLVLGYTDAEFCNQE